MRVFAIVLFVLGFALPAHANDTIKVIESQHSVKVTLDRLTKILKSKGIKIMARVNHGAGAKSVGLDLPDTELLIFGNPKLGTPLMQTNRLAGLDLPMKALAWKDKDGKVKLAYVAPSELSNRHNLGARAKIIAIMTKALGGLTAAAAGKK